MSSSSLSSSSSAKPLCFCNIEATLRCSKTKRNPGRPFLGCPKYNTKGLPYCKYFKWVDSNQYIESEIQEIKNELLRKEEELEKRLIDVERMEIQLRKIVDEIEKREIVLSKRDEEVQKKELELLEREALLKRSRTLPRLYWGFVIVVCWQFTMNALFSRACPLLFVFILLAPPKPCYAVWVVS